MRIKSGPAVVSSESDDVLSGAKTSFAQTWKSSKRLGFALLRKIGGADSLALPLNSK